MLLQRLLPPPKETMLEHGIRIVVAPSATGQGRHTKWIYDGEDMTMDDDTILADDIFDGSLSMLSSEKESDFSSGSLSSLDSLTDSVASVLRGAARAPARSIYTPSPHASFNPGSVLATPRKARGKPLVRSPAYIHGLDPELWQDDPEILSTLDFNEDRTYARLRVEQPTDEEQEATRRKVAEKQERQAVRIFEVELERMRKSKDFQLGERERVLKLTNAQLEEENAYWNKHGYPHPRSLIWKKGVRFDVSDSSSDADDEDDAMTEENISSDGPEWTTRQLGRQDTILWEEEQVEFVREDSMDVEKECTPRIRRRFGPEGTHLFDDTEPVAEPSRRLGPQGTHIIDGTTFQSSPRRGQPLGPQGTHLLINPAAVEHTNNLGPHGTHLILRLGPHGTQIIDD